MAITVVPTNVLGVLLKELDNLPEQIKRGRQKQKELIVQTYIDELKKVVRVNREGELRQSLGQEINAIVASSKTPLELKRNLDAALARRALAASGQQAKQVQKNIESAARATVAATESVLPNLVAKLPTTEEITTAFAKSPVTQKELWVQTLAAQTQETGAIDLVAVERRSRTAEALLSTPQGENLTTPAVFFQTGAKGIKNVIADVLLTVLPKSTRDTIIESVLRKGLELQTETGKRIVGSPLFESLAQDKSAGRAPRGFWSSVGDVASSIFDKPRSIEDMVWLVEMGIIKAEYVTGYQQLYIAGAHAKRPGMFGLVFSEAAGWGIRKVAGALAVKAGGTWFGRALGFLAGSVATPISGFIGAILGGALFGKAGSFLNSIFGKKPAGNPQPWFKNWSLDGILLPLVVVLSPLLLVAILFFTMFNVTTGALQEYATGGGEEGSTYITLNKTPNQSSFPENNARSVTYTIRVVPTNPGDTLDVTEIRDEFTVLAKTGEPEIPPPAISPEDVAGGKEFSYTVALGPQFRDSLIANTLTVVASVAGRSGETKSISSSVVIGNPPTECFTFSDERVPDSYKHTSSAWDDKSGVLAAIAILRKSKSYMAYACAGGMPITLHRVKADFAGGSVNSPNDIFLYNAGIRGTSAVRTLAHETGHIINRRTGLGDDFRSQGIYALEGPIWTYVNEYSENEDFAETLGAYPVYKSHTFLRRGTRLNYPHEYPLHYEFAKNVFGIEY